MLHEASVLPIPEWCSKCEPDSGKGKDKGKLGKGKDKGKSGS